MDLESSVMTFGFVFRIPTEEYKKISQIISAIFVKSDVMSDLKIIKQKLLLYFWG